MRKVAGDMNIFFRILLAVYAFSMAIISTLTMIIAFRPDTFERISLSLTNNVLLDAGSRIVLFLIALIFFVLSITFLFSGIKSNRDKKAVSKYTNIGEIKISLNSLENIALNTVRRLSGIKESKAYVSRSGDNVSIAIKVIVMPDINIPALSEEIQSRVKKAVEDSSGISVAGVKVMVDNISAGTLFKARVE
jgi:uncharacterized alkaline shock family protein YloU